MRTTASPTRLAATLGVVAVVAMLAFGPAMATFAGDVLAPAEPEAGESLVLEPHPGPNGEYAFINADDELEIVAEDVNPETRTDFEDVFTITNNASRAVEVNISHDSEDAVVFDSNATSTFGAIQTADGIEIPANETVSVGFHVDSFDAAAGETLLETVTFRATWASEENGGGGTGPSATESLSVSTGTPTPTPTPTDISSTTATPTPTDDGTTPAGTSDESTPTPTPTPTSTTDDGTTPAGPTDTPQEEAAFGGSFLWLLALIVVLGGGLYVYRKASGV